MTDAAFNTALETFVAKCTEINHLENAANDWKNDTFGVTMGKSYARVVRYNDGHRTQRSVHCFVALVEKTTKSVGTVKVGDVLKAATWSTPARGVRGNIFDDQNGVGRMGCYGPAYN